MADRSFAKRLNTACDGHPSIPPYGQGRQTWVKENLDVSHEAVRKWFTGESRPRPNKMRELAKVLEVDEAWLSLGITPDLAPAEKRVRNAQAEGAANAFMGLIQLNGANVALPDEKDPRAEFVDFYAVFRGLQVPIHVSLATEVSQGNFRFNVPKQFDQCTVVGVIHVYSMRIHALKMTYPMIDKHKIRKGGYFEINVNRVNNAYYTGSDQWNQIRDFREF